MLLFQLVLDPLSDSRTGVGKWPPDASERTTVPTHAIKTFADLGVPDALVERLEQEGIVVAFPILAATLPDSLQGRDVLGRGQTGSGKTLAFALALINTLLEAPSPRESLSPRARSCSQRANLLSKSQTLSPHLPK